MTVTYGNDPGANPVDHVRLLVGDTNCKLARLTDEEIQFRLDTESDDEFLAAWRSCQDIVAQLTGTAADWSAGPQSQQKSQLLEHYKKLEISLRTRGPGEFAAITAGGIDKSEKQANEDDDTVVQGIIRSNQFRNRRRGASNDQTSLKEVFD